jgi:hypothetical protein
MNKNCLELSMKVLKNILIGIVYIYFLFFEYIVQTGYAKDNNGVVTFVEFVCSMWNLLTLSDTDLSMMMFLLKDPTGEQSLSCK